MKGSLRTKIIQKLVEINEKLIFYPKLKRFYAEMLAGKKATIIDVGSNKGQSIDFFLKIDKEVSVFGFEPNKKLYDRLVQKYTDNANIVLANKGISSIQGTLVFHENIMDETSTFEELNYDSEYLRKKARVLGVSPKELVTGSYEVDVTTLAHFLHHHEGVFFDVLKIDVEGHELQGLKGLFSGRTGAPCPVRFIQIESHNDDMYKNSGHPAEIEKLLEDNGFLPKAKIKHGFGDFNEIIYENNNL